jgi:vacuolar iron transporter family protein
MLLLNYRTCKLLILNNQRHIEPHIKESNHIRDFVFGFGDGLNSSLGIVAGVGGANSSADFIILAALVGMFTGAGNGSTKLSSSKIPKRDFRIRNKKRGI